MASRSIQPCLTGRRSPSRRSGRTIELLFLILIALAASDAAAQPASRWIVVGSRPADAVEQRLTQILRDRVGTVLKPEAPTEVLNPAAFAKELIDFNVKQTVFVVTDPASLSEVSARGGWQELAARGFELVSPRIWGRTLYVFQACPGPPTAQCPDLRGTAGLRGYVRWAGSEDPEVRTRASTILRRLGYENVSFTFMNRPDAMASGLRGNASGGVDLVCIFDEEPSGFLNGFVTALTARARLVAVEQDTDVPSFTVTNGIPSVAIPYDTQRFYRFRSNIDVPAAPTEKRVPTVMVTPPPTTPDAGVMLPLVLTNARRTGDLGKLQGALNSSLSQVTSTAYVRTLFDEGKSRCDSRDLVSSEQFKTVLLNSFLADRSNPYAVLGLFGHLVLAQNASDAAAVRVFKDILINEYGVSATSSEGISKWLREHPGQPRITKVDLRARFANYPPERIYSEAVASLSTALRETRPAERRRQLETSRDTLVSLAEVALPSTCGKREAQRGLWTGMDFEPFFYLSVINAALSEMGPAK